MVGSNAHGDPEASEDPSKGASSGAAPGPHRRRRKGTPTCQYCKRTFVKAEHLQRHERSHTKDQPYQCEGCGSLFTRQDSLVRHQKKCEDALKQGDAVATTSRGSASHDGSDVAGDAYGQGQRLDTSPWDAADSAVNHHSMTHSNPAPPITSLPFAPSHTAQALPPVHTAHDPFPSFSNPPPIDMAAPLFGIGEPFDIWQLLTSDSLVGSESMHASPDFLDSLGLGGSFMRSGGRSQASSGPETGTDTIATTDAPTPGHMRAAQNPSPEVASIRGEEAVTEIQSMVRDLSSRVTSALTPLSSRWLNRCFQLFWSQFIPTFPVMHPYTFDIRSASAPLLLNMIAIGSLSLSGPENRAKGVALWRLVHKSVAGSWDQFIKVQGPYDPCKGIQLVLTCLLGQVFATMSTINDVTQTAMTYEGLIFRWSEIAGIPQCIQGSDTSLDVMDEEGWRRWAALETAKRVILGHYVLDGTISTSFDITPAARYTFHPVVLASDDASFLAPTVESWRQTFPNTHSTTFTRFFNALISPNDLLPISPSPLNLHTVLALVNSLVSEWDKSNDGAIALAPSCSIVRALVRVYPIIKDNLILVARWHAISIYAAKTFWRLERSTVSFQQSPYGRRALLHGVALRTIAEQLPVPTTTFPDFTLPMSFFRGAMTLAKSPVEAGLGDPNHQLNLDLPIDWEEIGVSGLVSETGASEMSAYSRYVLFGGTLTSRGAPIVYHDVHPFTAILSAFGRIWPSAETYAATIDETLW